MKDQKTQPVLSVLLNKIMSGLKPLQMTVHDVHMFSFHRFTVRPSNTHDCDSNNIVCYTAEPYTKQQQQQQHTHTHTYTHTQKI